jgi:high-affinity K+ transport system ATPase subunit B
MSALTAAAPAGDRRAACGARHLVPAGDRRVPGRRRAVRRADESAITGESAPVIRESGGDRSAVTGGT